METSSVDRTERGGTRQAGCLRPGVCTPVQRDDLWKQALGDWDMRNVQDVDYWHNEGRVEGRVEGQLEARRDDLVALLDKRFGSLPQELRHASRR